MENAYIKTPGEALKAFQVTEHAGLSEQQVQSAREKYGKNGMHYMAFGDSNWIC
jgi:Ca2+ transporting ATPase